MFREAIGAQRAFCHNDRTDGRPDSSVEVFSGIKLISKYPSARDIMNMVFQAPHLGLAQVGPHLESAWLHQALSRV